METTAQQRIIRPGYKQTDVGTIPEDWKLTDFDALGNVIDGDRGANYPSSGDFSDSGYCLFLNAGNVTKDGFRFTDCAFITREKDLQLHKGRLMRNDIVLTTRGTVGNAAHFDASVPFEHMRINSGMVILRSASPLLDASFLYCLLRSRLIQKQIERLSFGSAQPQLTVKGISKFRIVLPLLPEQRLIADAMTDIDVLIASLEQLIAKKQDLKLATMQQLLTGTRRLPGFTDEWRVRKLGEIATFLHGHGLSKADLHEDGKYKCIHYGELFTEYDELISEIRNRTSIQGGAVCSQINDVLMPTSDVTPRGLSTASCIKENGIVLGGGILIIRLHAGYEGLFFSYLINLNKESILRLVKGSTVYHLYAADLATLEIQWPEYKEQVAITEVLTDMSIEIKKLEQKREKNSRRKAGDDATIIDR